jgi:hypothetical protein
MRAALATINTKNASDSGATSTGNMATQRKHAASCARRATAAIRLGRSTVDAFMEVDSILSIRKRSESWVDRLC